MGCGGSAGAKPADEENKFDKNVKQLVLLGGAESGKTTVLKQIKIHHAKGYTDEEAKTYIPAIHWNAIHPVQKLIMAARAAKMPLPSVAALEGEEKKEAEEFIEQVLSWENNMVLDPTKASKLQVLSRDKTLQELFVSAAAELSFESNAKYFMEDLPRIAAPSYLPSYDDILRVRMRTQAANSLDFEMDRVKFRIFDLVGQKLERFKWTFQGFLTALIYLAPLTEFDMTLAENSALNRLDDSLQLFHLAVNKLFPEQPIILFLNKQDLLQDKIKNPKYDVGKWFPELKGCHDPAKVEQHIEELYRKQKENSEQKLYVMKTTATDRKNMVFILNAVKQILIENSMAELGFI